MPTFASLWALALFASGAAAAEQAPPAWLAQQEADFTALYRARNFSAVAQTHSYDACVVPPSADEFVAAGRAAGFYRNASAAGIQVELAPRAALSQNPAMMGAALATHVVGRNRATGAAYYKRYESFDRVHWALNTFLMGGSSDLFSSPASSPPSAGAAPFLGAAAEAGIPDWAAQRISEIKTFSDAGLLANLTDLYQANAVVAPLQGVADEALKLYTKEDMKGVVAGFAAAVAAGSAQPLGMYFLDGFLCHMIGEVAPRAGDGAATPQRFYMRWARQLGTDADWRIETHVIGIGAPWSNAQPPPQWMQALEVGYGAEFSAQAYQALQAHHMPYGFVIPRYPAGGYISGAAAGVHFKKAFEAGLRMDLAPRAAVSLMSPMMGAIHSFHSVGLNVATQEPYYIRYESVDTKHWGIAAVFGLGSAAGSELAAAAPNGSVPEWMSTRVGQMAGFCNATNGSLADLYTSDAVYASIDPVYAATTPEHLKIQGALAAHAETLACQYSSGLKIVRAWSDDAWLSHMIAEVQPAGTEAPQRFYMRWARQVGTWDDFRIEAHVAGIGSGRKAETQAPATHAPLETPAPPTPPPTPFPTFAPRPSPKGQEPTSAVRELEAMYSRAFSSGDLKTLTPLSGPYGALVPREADHMFTKTTLASFQKQVVTQGPGLHLDSYAARKVRPMLMDAPYVTHTLGQNALNGGLYYMRWETLNGQDHWVDSMVMGIGAAHLQAPAPPLCCGAPVPAWMSARVAEVEAAYRKGNATGLASLHTKNAAVVPPAADRIVAAEDGLDAFFAGVLAGFRGASVSVTSVTPIDGWLHHMLGEVRVEGAVAHRFYMRWARQIGTWDDWRIEAHVMVVGNPSSWGVAH